MKIKKNTFNKYNKNTILLPNTLPKHNVKYYDSTQFHNYDISFYDKIYNESQQRGIPMHTECWNLAKKKFNHELKFEDFVYNKYDKIINSKLTKKNLGNNFNYYISPYLLHYLNYDVVKKYMSQFWDDNIYNDYNNFLLNEKDWYVLYLPSGNSKRIKKNSKRIEKI